MSTALAVGDRAGDPAARESAGTAALPDDVSIPLGCSSALTPPFASLPPDQLRVSGAWQRCGAFGAGGVQVMRVAANAPRAVAVSYAGDAYVLALPALQKLQRFSHGSGRAAYAAISADGSRVATINDLAGQVALWDVDSGALLRTIERPPAWPSYINSSADLAFSSDGARLAVASAQHLEVYDVASGAALPISLRTDGDNGNRLAFVDGDTRLAVVDYGFFGNGPYLGGIRVDVMDADTGDNRVTLPATYNVAVPAMVASADGSTIAFTVFANEGIQFFDAHSGMEIPHAFIDARPLALSADGTRVAVLEGPYRSTVAVRRVADGVLLASIQAPNFYDNGMGGDRGPIELTPDLSLALFADFPVHPAVVAMSMSDGATTGTACSVGHSSVVQGLAESHDGLRLVSSGQFDEAPQLVWDTRTGQPLDEPAPADAETMDPNSPDGRYTAVPGGDDSFEVRDRTSGSPVALFGPHPSEVLTIDWSANSNLLVSVAQRVPVDRWQFPPTVKLWDLASLQLLQSLETQDYLPALFAPHGDTIYVAGSGTTTVWCR